MDDAKRTAEEEKQSYLDGYEKDAAAWRSRLAALDDEGAGEDDPRREAAKEALESALNLLKQLGGAEQKAAAKRPARAKETR